MRTKVSFAGEHVLLSQHLLKPHIHEHVTSTDLSSIPRSREFTCVCFKDNYLDRQERWQSMSTGGIRKYYH